MAVIVRCPRCGAPLDISQFMLNPDTIQIARSVVDCAADCRRVAEIEADLNDLKAREGVLVMQGYGDPSGEYAKYAEATFPHIDEQVRELKSELDRLRGRMRHIPQPVAPSSANGCESVPAPTQRPQPVHSLVPQRRSIPWRIFAITLGLVVIYCLIWLIVRL